MASWICLEIGNHAKACFFSPSIHMLVFSMAPLSYSKKRLGHRFSKTGHRELEELRRLAGEQLKKSISGRSRPPKATSEAPIWGVSQFDCSWWASTVLPFFRQKRFWRVAEGSKKEGRHAVTQISCCVGVVNLGLAFRQARWKKKKNKYEQVGYFCAWTRETTCFRFGFCLASMVCLIMGIWIICYLGKGKWTSNLEGLKPRFSS